MGDVYTFLGK